MIRFATSCWAPSFFDLISLQAGQICRIWEASEQVLKVPTVALPVITAAAPLLQALAGSPLGSLVPASWPSAPIPAAPAFAAAGGASRQQWAASSSPSSSSSGTSSWSRGASGRPAGSSWGTGAAPPARSPTILPSAAGSGTSSPSSSTSGGAGIEGLAGVWIKDQAASDSVSYSRACDLMQLNGLQKQTAMQLIEGLEIEQQGQQAVAVRYLTGMGGQ